MSADNPDNPAEQPATLSHLDATGAARMVDVADKPITHRVAVAGAFIEMAPATLEMIVTGSAPKGDVLATARIAGIMAAKRTAELIPMCHPLNITHAAVDLVPERRATPAPSTGPAWPPWWPAVPTPTAFPAAAAPCCTTWRRPARCWPSRRRRTTARWSI